MHNEIFSSLSTRKIRGAYQLGWRNSNAYRRLGESILRKDASRSSFTSNCGGSWNRIGPALSPSNEMRSSKSSRLLIDFSDSRFQCVMNFDAFQANTKSSGVCSRQPFTASGVGVRYNTPL